MDQHLVEQFIASYLKNKMKEQLRESYISSSLSFKEEDKPESFVSWEVNNPNMINYMYDLMMNRGTMEASFFMDQIMDDNLFASLVVYVDLPDDYDFDTTTFEQDKRIVANAIKKMHTMLKAGYEEMNEKK